jgi:hypothetical protein
MKRYLLLSSLVLAAGCAADSVESPDSDQIYSFTADGRVVAGESPDKPIETRLLAELVLPNGNIMRFAEHPDGGLEVSEEGRLGTNAVGELAEFADASPYEMFVALAPKATIVPAVLAANQERVVAERARTNTFSSVPPGFRVDALPDFYAKDLSRAFNTCTDTTAWAQHVGASTIGDNCSAMAGLHVNWCDSNFTPDLASSCPDDPDHCTTYMESGYRKTRASVCGRAGSGTNKFEMGIKAHSLTSDWEIWINKTVNDGAYFYYWLTYESTKKDFWRGDTRTGTRKINRSWWVKQ